jgi:RNA-directed DNA polymerase
MKDGKAGFALHGPSGKYYLYHRCARIRVPASLSPGVPLSTRLTQLDLLRATMSLSDFARYLQYPPSFLAFVLYKGPSSGRYTSFSIPKRSGGTRVIHAPDHHLKELQRRLAKQLELCKTEIANRRGFADKFSHGFEPGRSIITNAWPHKRRRFVLNLDLEEFFPSINFGRVRGYFLKNRDFGLHPDVATIIAQIACFQNALPQGAPSSPVIANLIAHVLDVRLGKLAATVKCTYSRYADDLTLSTNQKDFPAALASPDPMSAGGWAISGTLLDEIRRTGFNVHPAKTRMQRRPSHQVVTGLTVNDKVNVRAPYYRAARATCDSLFKTGSYYRGATSSKTLPAGTPPAKENGIAYLEGVMAHIYHVKRTSDLRSGRLDPKRESEDLKRARYPGYRELFKKLLYFRHFVALEQPLIVCEGKTDNIYLRSALKALDPRYPQLAKVEKGVLTTEVKFLKHSRAEHDILELSGGSGNLANLIARYKKTVSRYAYRPLKYPVIVLIDNDSGSNPVFGAMKEHGITVSQTTTSPFYHVYFNLYVVKTPEIGAAGTSCIENLYPPEVLATKLDGKAFSLAKEWDSKTHYGKFEFADRVVRSNYKAIDFSQFEPLLGRLLDVIADYPSRKT